MSAPLALREARRLCLRDPESDEDCSWYHGIWQYLRLLDIVSAANKHAGFFEDALAPLARDGASPRILISGTADYSLSAQVLWIYGRAAANAAMTVLDICETPLFLSRWYAERIGARIETRACDVIGFSADRPFDVVCTHSFFGRFAPERRPSLIAAWRRLLRPGGKVVTVNRVRSAARDERVRFTGKQSDDLITRALAAAEARPRGFDLDRDTLIAEVRRFIGGKASHPMRSPEELRRLFEDGGFALDRFEFAGPETDPQGGLSTGPSVFSKSDYVKLVATRV